MTALALALAFVLGIALGVAYFTALRWNVQLYLIAGRRGAGIALHVARLAAVVAALWLASRAGAGPLLAMAGGLLIARPIVTRREVP